MQKPGAAARGVGIKVVTKLEQISKSKTGLIQAYLRYVPHERSNTYIEPGIAIKEPSCRSKETQQLMRRGAKSSMLRKEPCTSEKEPFFSPKVT
jgi:hypothetical protein